MPCRGLDVWIVDALRPTPHPSHLSLPESLALIARMQPREAVLTNLHLDLDYAETDRTTPANVRPAYDGLQIDVTAGPVLSPTLGDVARHELDGLAVRTFDIGQPQHHPADAASR